MKRSVLIFVLAVALVLAIAIPTLAGPQKSMVTGSGYWTNTAGPHHVYAKFNAQEAYNGQPAKGYLYQENLDTGAWREVDVDLVVIEDTTAYFSGMVVQGSNASDIGSRWWVLVQDGGSGMDEVGMDYFRGGKSAGEPWWVAAKDFANNTPWYEGNVQIH